MAAATTLLTLDEYHRCYATENGYEYWFGEAVRKSVPTLLHSILQIILGEFLYRMGYVSASELDLRIDPNWEPRPDVCAMLTPQHPYPTRPVAVVAEILSPDDPMSKVFEKCRRYKHIGIGQVFVFDPEAHVGWEWSSATENLERIHILELGNGSKMDLAEVWNELAVRATLQGS